MVTELVILSNSTGHYSFDRANTGDGHTEDRVAKSTNKMEDAVASGRRELSLAGELQCASLNFPADRSVCVRVPFGDNGGGETDMTRLDDFPCSQIRLKQCTFTWIRKVNYLHSYY